MTTLRLHTNTATVRPSWAQSQCSRDISGFALFSAGDNGSAHVMAHRMLDRSCPDLGHQLLGEWLDGRSGAGSDWVHIQWHMGVFELALGHWNAAFDRFREHILPAAATTEHALTDAPAMLWRLALSAPAPVELPWEPVRATALRCMQRPCEPFVELHNLLALAGAKDVAGLDRWLQSRPAAFPTRRERLVERTALALRAYAARDFRKAAAILTNILPFMADVGGSRAQIELFEQLQQASHRKAVVNESASLDLKAA